MAVASFSGHFLHDLGTRLQVHQLYCCSLILRPFPSSSHMTWEWGYKFTNFTAVASFSGHFLAPPTWPGNKEYDPASVCLLVRSYQIASSSQTCSQTCCSHTFWHAIPTSFYIFNVFKSCFCTFLMLTSVTVTPKPKKNISFKCNYNPRT